jgi:hypothetical protein
MSRPKRKSYFWIVRKGYWWVPSLRKWVSDDDIIGLDVDYCSHRRFRTLKRLERAIQSTDPPFYATADYYKSSKRGKGWCTHWVYEEL